MPGVGDGLHGLSCGQAASREILYDDEQRTAVRQKLPHLMRTAVKSDFCYLLTLSHPPKGFRIKPQKTVKLNLGVRRVGAGPSTAKCPPSVVQHLRCVSDNTAKRT